MGTIRFRGSAYTVSQPERDFRAASRGQSHSLTFFFHTRGPKAQGPIDPSKPQNEIFKANWVILGATAVLVICPKQARSAMILGSVELRVVEGVKHFRPELHACRLHSASSVRKFLIKGQIGIVLSRTTDDARPGVSKCGAAIGADHWVVACEATLIDEVVEFALNLAGAAHLRQRYSSEPVVRSRHRVRSCRKG